MCFSSLVLSRRPKIFNKRPKTLKNPLTPIGSCRDLHIYIYIYIYPGSWLQGIGVPPNPPIPEHPSRRCFCDLLGLPLDLLGLCVTLFTSLEVFLRTSGGPRGSQIDRFGGWPTCLKCSK